ncbi:MAG: glycosyltransferase family 4 protein [Candidatus Omnitrophota bacterium]
MKILQVVHNFLPYSYGGTQIHTYHLSKELSKQHEVFIFHRLRDEKRKDYQLQEKRFDDLTCFSINNTCRNYNCFEDTYVNKSIEERFVFVLEEVKPHIVHIHHLHFLSASIIAAIKKRNIPIVFTLHDYWLLCPQGQFLYNSMSLCGGADSKRCVGCMISRLSYKKGVLALYYKLSRLLPRLMVQWLKAGYLIYAKKTFLSKNDAVNKILERKWVVNKVFSDVDMFIVPSRFLLNKFVASGIARDKISFIANGIEAGRFADFKRKQSDKLRFGFIGAIHPAKGVHILIEAFNRITDSDVELKIYGKAEPYIGVESYAKKVRKSCKNNNIRFIGEFNNSCVGDVLSEIDLLVFPSIWHENAPLVLLEALLTQTPVIAARAGGVPELIEDNKNGLLFESGSVDDLYAKMKNAIDNRRLLEELSQHKNQVKSIEENARDIEKVYSELVNKVSLHVTNKR